MNQVTAQNSGRRGLAAQSIANLGAASPPYLSIKGNRFTLIDAAGNEQPVPTYEGQPERCLRGQSVGPYADVLICDVNTHVSRIFYDEPFDPNANTYQPPACFSHNGIAPSNQAARPQSQTCAACPNAMWGSATSNVSGKGIPACSQYQMLAILVGGHDSPFLLRVPPNSLKNYKAYANLFVGKAFDLNNVVTRISFESQGTLAFCPVGQAPAEMTALDARVYEGGATASIVGKTDVPIAGLLSAPAAQPMSPPQQFVVPLPMQPLAPLPALLSAPAAQPMSPPQQFVVPLPVQPLAPLPAQLPPAQPAAAPEAPAQSASRGRGRPRNQPAQQGNGAGPAGQQAPFPHQAPAAQAAIGTAPQAPPAPVPQNIGGMAPGAAPTDEMSKMLDSMFGPPA